MFLYRLTSIRNGSKDSVIILGGTHYYHDQLLMIIEAEDAERAAHALNIKIIGSFDRSSVNCPTIYYTSDYYGGNPHPLNHPKGYFFLSLKELEACDEARHSDLQEKIRLKVSAP